MEVQEIFDTLPEPTVGDGEEALGDFDKTVKMLDTHFAYRPNTTFERHVFRQMQQREGETCVQFSQWLRQQANCVPSPTRMIRSGIRTVERCLDEKLRRKLLEKGDALTLNSLLEMTSIHETTEASAKGMRLGESSQVENLKPVRRVGSETKPAKSTKAATKRECGNCGSWHHATGASTCPARDATCFNCGKTGHFRSKCRGKLSGSSKTKKQKPAGHVKTVTNDDADDSDEMQATICSVHPKRS